MDNKYLFLFSVYTTVLFFIARMVEMKFVKQELIPLKFIISDLLVVFGCSIAASYGYTFSSGFFGNFMNFVTENKSAEIGAPEIFTNVPEF